MTARILQGDAAERLRELPSGSAHCIVTSPPYYGLRRYSAGPQEMGSEATPEAYLAAMVAVFREARRVLRDDGTCWVDIGDTYTSSFYSHNYPRNVAPSHGEWSRPGQHGSIEKRQTMETTTKTLNLLGLPERLVLALQADGWTWRSTVVWAKPAPMPESVRGWAWEQHRVKIGLRTGGRKQDTSPGAFEAQAGGSGPLPEYGPCPGCPACAANDGLVLRRGSWRPTRAWEPIFMLTKGSGYYGDGEAVREPHAESSKVRASSPANPRNRAGIASGNKGSDWHPEQVILSLGGANPRNVWVIPPEPCNWDFCLTCGTWYGKGGWQRKSIKRWTTKELDIETEEYKSVPHRRCAHCKAVDEFVDHFAAFPSELPRRCIAASTSERGVCPECGAPWARVMERATLTAHDGTTTSVYPEGSTAKRLALLRQAARERGGEYQQQDHTLGWRATCSCAAGEPVAATVLDCFMGTGTTLLAAARLGRDAIGIELSDRYVALAQERLRADAPLLYGMAPAGPTVPKAAEEGAEAV